MNLENAKMKHHQLSHPTNDEFNERRKKEEKKNGKKAHWALNSPLCHVYITYNIKSHTSTHINKNYNSTTARAVHSSSILENGASIVYFNNLFFLFLFRSTYNGIVSTERIWIIKWSTESRRETSYERSEVKRKNVIK